MLFSSITFIFLFLPILLAVYYLTRLSKKTILTNIVLLIASLIFYTFGEGILILLMLGVILLNYFAGLLMGKYGKYRKLILAIAISLNLSVLFYFKYLNFFDNVFCSVFQISPSIPAIILPIGISFYIFQAISYVIDVYRGGEVQKNLLDLALYVSFFPQLVAGPIIRYSTIASQLISRTETTDKIYDGIHRFVFGLSKKVILANNIAIMVDLIFANLPSDPLLAWIGAVGYALQIYFDFSGYSDMAIGLGKMFGFDFPENFNYPYVSHNISEFWRRWHISLGNWFRDYVYFPLGGSRVNGKWRLVFNLLVVWFLTGLWHGANWTFIIWGLFNCAFIILDKLINFDYKTHKAVRLISVPFTFVIIVIGWVFFRSDSIGVAFDYIETMFTFNASPTSAGITLIREYCVYLILGLIFSMPLIPKIKATLKNFTFKHSDYLYNILTDIVCAALFVTCVSSLLANSYNPFIYFNF